MYPKYIHSIANDLYSKSILYQARKIIIFDADILLNHCIACIIRRKKSDPCPVSVTIYTHTVKNPCSGNFPTFNSEVLICPFWLENLFARLSSMHSKPFNPPVGLLIHDLLRSKCPMSGLCVGTRFHQGPGWPVQRKEKETGQRSIHFSEMICTYHFKEFS